MKDIGFVKISRKLLTSQVFQNEGLLKVWTWCLLRANYKEQWVSVATGRGSSEIMVKPGQFLFGRNTASMELRMKPSSVWARMKKLEKMKNIIIQPDTHYSLILIVNWDGYQARERVSDNQPDNEVTTNQQPSDTDKKVKKKKNTPPGKNSGIALEALRARFDQNLLEELFTAIASTRKAGKVAESVLLDMLVSLERFPVEQVEAGCRIYLEKRYFEQGKGEKYLVGIIRGQLRSGSVLPAKHQDWWQEAGAI